MSNSICLHSIENNKMKAVTIEDIFLPITWSSEICGINFIYGKNGRPVYSVPKLLYTLLWVSLSAYLAIDYSNNYITFLNWTKNQTIIFIVVCRCFGGMTVMLVTMVFVRKNWIAISALLTKLKEVDCLLTSMDQQESVSKMNRKHQRFVIILMVVHNLCFATLAEIYTAWVNPHASLHFFIVYTYPRLVCSTVNIKFVVYASILRGRFKIINDFISAKLSTDRDFCEQLTRVVSLHKLLVQLSRQLNSIFSLHLLMWLAICFGLLVGDLYAGLYVIFFDSRSAFHLALILITYKNCVVSAFDIWSFAKMCNELSHEVSRCV
jgi:hypothetical protein